MYTCMHNVEWVDQMQAKVIADQVKTALLRGAFQPGEKLKQEDLAKLYGASRIPVRDALALLAIDGLVVLTPNKGAHVVAMTEVEIREAFDLRVMLEADVLRRATPRHDVKSLEKLHYALRRSDLEALGPDWAEGDRMFHAALYAPAGRGRQIAMIEGLRIACQIQIAAYSALPERTPDWLSDHHLIVEAVQAGGVETAVQNLIRHLREAEAHLLAAMSGKPFKN